MGPPHTCPFHLLLSLHVPVLTVTQVCSVLQHSSYDSASVDYDFAVLRLCEDLTFQVAASSHSPLTISSRRTSSQLACPPASLMITMIET